MIISDRCYTYNLTERKQTRIKKRIKRHKTARNLYVIVLPLLRDGLMEIYHYNQLLQKPYRKMDSRIQVVGFARGKEAAEQLVLQIIQDMYDETGEEWKVEDFFF